MALGKLVSSTALAVVCWISCAPASSRADGRRFQMGLWDDERGTVSDLAFFSVGAPQPPGRSVLNFGLYGISFEAAVSGQNYDFSRIDAVVIDEPYLVALGPAPSNAAHPWQNPCVAGDPRCSKVSQTKAQLEAIGAEVKRVSARTRYWVNFSEPELQWMGAGPLNSSPPLELHGTWADVISLDLYGRDFASTVRPYYDFLVAHRAAPWQQLALVPGTFVMTTPDVNGAVEPAYVGANQASRLQGFFDYATEQNQSCSLPLGSTGLTGSSDGCLLWLVAGWCGRSFGVEGAHYHGMLNDPRALTPAVSARWNQERTRPLSPPPSGAAAAAIISTVYPALY